MNFQQIEYYNQFDTTKGVYYIQQERVDQLNERIVERQFADKPLEPNYDPRPVPTKYSLFPAIDRRKAIKERRQNFDEYDLQNNFAGITYDGPFSGYVNNIEKENNLRNQYFALQGGDPIQSAYIPSTDSDLYNVTIVSKPSEQPFKELFSSSNLDQSPHPNLVGETNIGKEQFYNHTRTQLRNSA